MARSSWRRRKWSWRQPVSRRALPKTLPLADAVFNVQHVALLLGALQSGRVADMREALRDRAHQPYRQRLVPGLRRLLALRHPDVIGFCLSGAGPSVAAFASGNAAGVEKLIAQVTPKSGYRAR